MGQARAAIKKIVFFAVEAMAHRFQERFCKFESASPNATDRRTGRRLNGVNAADSIERETTLAAGGERQTSNGRIPRRQIFRLPDGGNVPHPTAHLVPQQRYASHRRAMERPVPSRRHAVTPSRHPIPRLQQTQPQRNERAANHAVEQLRARRHVLLHQRNQHHVKGV